MVLADGAGTPLGIQVAAASPSEVKLVESTLESLPDDGQPERLIGDKGYDSNPLRAWLAARDIEPIIPARSNNRVATHQDGRKLRRYKKRWIIERTNSWLQNFRRLVVRYERKATNFVALVHLACALITLNKVFG
jgi:transposase